MIEHLPPNDISQRYPMLVNLGNEKVYLDVEETLGKGAFGIVTRAVDNRGVSFAVKNVLCEDIDTYESVAQEVKILLKLKHPNIVAMYGFDFLNSTAVLIMEFCGQGTLNKRLDQPVDVMVQLQWMEQLRSAMTYLHGNNIVHRDLKTENVLLSESNDVKIADFGIARHFVCCRRGRMDIDPNNYISEYLDAYMGTFAGTPYWVAPEVFDNNYTEKADIFSLGIIFYAICERQYITFEDDRYYGAFTKYGGVDTGIGLVMFEQEQLIELVFHQTQSMNLKTSIHSMTHLEPESRISLMDLRAAINKSFLEILQTDAADGDERIEKNAMLLENKHNQYIEDSKHTDPTGIGSEKQFGIESENITDYVYIDVPEDTSFSAQGVEQKCRCSWLKWIICGCRCTCNAGYFHVALTS